MLFRKMKDLLHIFLYMDFGLIILFFTLFRSPMIWNDEKDVLFIREMVIVEPYKHKEKSRERGQAWQDLPDHLNELPGFTVSARAVRERFKDAQGV